MKQGMDQTEIDEYETWSGLAEAVIDAKREGDKVERAIALLRDVVGGHADRCEECCSCRYLPKLLAIVFSELGGDEVDLRRLPAAVLEYEIANPEDGEEEDAPTAEEIG